MARLGTFVRETTPALSQAVSLLAIFVAVLSLPLAIAADLGLSRGETASWVLAVSPGRVCSAWCWWPGTASPFSSRATCSC